MHQRKVCENYECVIPSIININLELDLKTILVPHQIKIFKTHGGNLPLSTSTPTLFFGDPCMLSKPLLVTFYCLGSLVGVSSTLYIPPSDDFVLWFGGRRAASWFSGSVSFLIKVINWYDSYSVWIKL